MRSIQEVGRKTLLAVAVAVLLLCAGCPQLPDARIAASIRVGEAPLTVEFHDISWPQGSAIVSWAWSFGDGATSTEQDPVHLYTEPGYHTVTLTVTNANGSATEVQTDYIQVLAVTLAEGDRVGVVYGAVEPDGSKVAGDQVLRSSAVLVPGEMEQFTSLGYLASTLNGHGMNVVETLEPDTPVVMTLDEFEAWLGGPRAPDGYPAIWYMAGLDAGEPGIVAAGQAYESLPRWEDAGLEGFDDDPPPIASGLYVQTESLTLPAVVDSVAFTWPGGVDLGAIDVDADLPEPLTVLSPVAFDPPDTPPEHQTMSKIPTSGALTITWEPSGAGSRYLQVYLLASAWNWGDRETKLLLARVVDDGSFTISAPVMAELPVEPADDRYEQRLMLSRIASADVDVPFAGGGNGQLRVAISTEPYVFDYSNEK